MVIIKNNTIPYLDERILNSYNNVTLLSTEGPQIKMNSLVLCALSHILKMVFHEDDDAHTIITEFSLEELKQVKDFCMRGSCNVKSEPILEAFGLLRKGEIKLRDHPINEIKTEPPNPTSLNSKSVMYSLENPMINSQILVKDEFIDIKEEPINNVHPNLKYSCDKSHSLKTKRKQIITKRIDYDCDWEPVPPSKIKPKKAKNGNSTTEDKKLELKQVTSQQFSNEEIDIIDEPTEVENMEYDVAMDYSSDDSLLRYGNDKRKKPKPKYINNLKSGIKVVKGMPRGRSKRQNEDIFKTFELPNPLEDYTKQPVEMSDELYRRSKDKEQKWSGATIGKAFTCSQCQLRFLTKAACIYHEIKFHYEHLQCTLCYRVDKVENVEEFKWHVFNHVVLGQGGLKECIQCGKAKKKKDAISRHLSFMGPLHNDECTQCSKKISSFKEYQEHVNKQHYGIWKYRCGFVNCGELFDKAKDCHNHTSSIHHKVAFHTGLPKESRILPKKICEQCGFLGHLKQHVCKSKAKERFEAKTEHPCNKCKQIFPTFKELKKHKRNRDAPCYKHYMIFCDLCGKELRPGSRSYHMLMAHTKSEDRPFKCTTCGKGFVHKHYLKDHVNIHTGEKPYKCLYCPASFASNGTYLMHQKGHLGIKRNHGGKRIYNRE